MERILVQNFDDGTSLFTINRPDKRNAICAKTARELQEAFVEFDQSSQRAAVITGAGDVAFSAGADVNDVPEFWRCVPTVGITTEKPVIAAVAGWCVGGSMLIPMLSDIAVVADNAKFSYPEARLGLTQGMIATLAGRIPHKFAMEIMILGRTIDAHRAREIGLVNDVVPLGQQVEHALSIARQFAAMAPLVLKTLKRMVTQGVLPVSPVERMAHARRDLEVVATSHDFEEGFASYKAKRAPVFQGR